MVHSKPCIPTPFDTTLLTTTIIFVVLATIAVLLRLLASHKADSKPWHHADMWLIVAALAMCYGYMIQTICAVGLTGVNCIRSNVDPTWASREVSKIMWTDMFLLIPASALVKISIMEFYKRIFVTSLCQWLCNIMTILCSIWAISAIFAQGFSTIPISASWDPTITKEYTNYDYPTFALAIFGIGMVLDLLVLVMPLPSIVKLHMPNSRKLKVTGIFALGSFCLVCTIMRLYYADRQSKHVYQSLSTEPVIDRDTAMWGRMEPAASIIAACMPTLGPLLSHHQSLRDIVQSAASILSLRGSRSSRDHSGRLAALKSSRSSSEDSANWPEFKQGEPGHHHASIHSGTRPGSIPTGPNQIAVTSEFSVDRERTRDSEKPSEWGSQSSSSS